MAKLNCWEIKKCEREQGGGKARELGVCPASTDMACDGINGGKGAGRLCWAIAGTFCGDQVQGDYAQKSISCMSCEVFKLVKKEEADSFCLLKPGQIYRSVK
ncbi:MAG: hypothetical protein OEU95_00355 [Nitrospirota bacterium]|nr:hypothetical protein [Nitrospirota bacterium]